MCVCVCVCVCVFLDLILRKEMETADESISIEIWRGARLVALRDSDSGGFLLSHHCHHQALQKKQII